MLLIFIVRKDVDLLNESGFWKNDNERPFKEYKKKLNEQTEDYIKLTKKEEAFLGKVFDKSKWGILPQRFNMTLENKDFCFSLLSIIDERILKQTGLSAHDINIKKTCCGKPASAKNSKGLYRFTIIRLLFSVE